MKISLKRLHPKGTSVDTVTYKAIKQNFTANAPNRIPTAKQLQNSNCVIMYRFYDSVGRYTILTNGLVIYEYEEESWDSGYPKIKQRVTVIPTHKMSFTYNTCSDTDAVGNLTIPESMYDFMPFIKVLQMFAIIRIQHNADSREAYYCKFHLNNDGTDWSQELQTADFTDDLLNNDDDLLHEQLSSVYNKLTERQRDAIYLRYNKEMTQEKIAEVLQITRSTVKDHLDSALKKFQKNML